MPYASLLTTIAPPSYEDTLLADQMVGLMESDSYDAPDDDSSPEEVSSTAVTMVDPGISSLLDANHADSNAGEVTAAMES